MRTAPDILISALDEVVGRDSAAGKVREALRRVLKQLDISAGQMAWEILPLSVFGRPLPESIRSTWVFVIRAGADTGAERHPNSHQRSLSLTGSGIFEVRKTGVWIPHSLVSTEHATAKQRWVSIPPATWHRLTAGPEPWGMLSFHTVNPEELIEERPVDQNDLDGETYQERYAGKR